MGLFNLGKKKNIPLASQLTPSEPELQQTGPAQMNEEKEDINFDELSDEVPIPPSDLPFNQAQSVKSASPGTKPFEKPKTMAESRELPDIGMPAQPKAGQESSAPRDKIIFELPDFLDEETKAIEEAKLVKKEIEKKQASQELAAPENKSFLKPEPVKPTVSPEPVKPRVYQEPKKEPIYQEPVKPRTYSKPEAPPQEIKLPAKEPFMDISRYFELKDDFEIIRKLISITQDKLEQEAMLSKEKSDKYQSVVETINYLQEKLMLMDTKLFES